MKEFSSLDVGKEQQNAIDNITSIANKTINEEKPGLLQTIREGFFQGEPKQAFAHVMVNVIEPAIKTMIFQSIQGFASVLIFGPKASGAVDPTSLDFYTKFFNGGKKKKKKEGGNMSEKCNSILFDDFSQADEALQYIRQYAATYDTVTVYELMDHCEVPRDFTMKNWGWADSDLTPSKAYPQQGPEGWSLRLPDPKPMSSIM